MKHDDGWYESEQPTRIGIVEELRRIALRFRVRPLPVLLLAGLVTAGITYRFVHKPKIYEADVTLALTEGSEFSGKNAIPFDQLREYVTSVLMPDAKLAKLIEERNLHRLRNRLGMQWAVGELRDQIEVAIWKNSFVYYAEEDAQARKSARIGLTVLDGNPELALMIARDLAAIVVQTHEEQRRIVSAALADQVWRLRESTNEKLRQLATEISVTQTALVTATRDGNTGLAGILYSEVAALAREEHDARDQLNLIARSPEAAADRITAAGLGTRIELVEERRPDRTEQAGLVLAMIIIVVGTGSLVGSALFLGAFDARIHDTDDVARLGLPVLGHVPGFPGDRVGSLSTRSVQRARVPLFLRWRSQR